MSIRGGDVVQVKSGGPKMTVEDVIIYIGKPNVAHCIRVDESGTVFRQEFSVHALEKVRS